MDHRPAVARRLADPDVARDHGAQHQRREVLGAARARRPARAACGRRTSSAACPRPRARGFSSRWISASVSRNCASPSSARYSACTGTITRSAATSALTDSGPSDGGQSSTIWSKLRARRRERLAQPLLRGLERAAARPSRRRGPASTAPPRACRPRSARAASARPSLAEQAGVGVRLEVLRQARARRSRCTAGRGRPAACGSRPRRRRRPC